MSGRSPSEAVNNFVTPLQRALSCVTDGVVRLLSGGREPGDVRGLVLGRNEPVTLGGPQRLLLHVAQKYEVVAVGGDLGPWKVSTRAYQYHVTRSDGTEILLFHWHPDPDGVSGIQDPHLHLGQAVLNPEGVMSRRTHVPTGRIALEEVVGLLVTEFEVVPKRVDWAEVLNECRAKFVQYRTWP